MKQLIAKIAGWFADKQPQPEPQPDPNQEPSKQPEKDWPPKC